VSARWDANANIQLNFFVPFVGFVVPDLKAQSRLYRRGLLLHVTISFFRADFVFGAKSYEYHAVIGLGIDEAPAVSEMKLVTSCKRTFETPDVYGCGKGEPGLQTLEDMVQNGVREASVLAPPCVGQEQRTCLQLSFHCPMQAMSDCTSGNVFKPLPASASRMADTVRVDGFLNVPGLLLTGDDPACFFFSDVVFMF
jgi:hypothetical protein